VDTESSRERGLSFPFRFVTALLPILSPIALLSIPGETGPTMRARGPAGPALPRGARHPSTSIRRVAADAKRSDEAI